MRFCTQPASLAYDAPALSSFPGKATSPKYNELAFSPVPALVLSDGQFQGLLTISGPGEKAAAIFPCAGFSACRARKISR